MPKNPRFFTLKHCNFMGQYIESVFDLPSSVVFLDHEIFFFSNLGNKIHSFLWNSHPLNFSEFKREKVTHGHLLRKKNVASKRFSLNCKLCLTFYCSKNAFTGELTLVNWIAFASFLHCNFASICALNW